MRSSSAEGICVSIQAKTRGLWIVAACGAMLVLFAPTATAQISSNNPSQILQQYRNFRTTWITNIWPYANTLFALLATIEFAWSAAVMALEKTDLQSWTAALIRKIMWLGAFYALLLFGRQWIPAIIDSFSQLGGAAAGINGNNGLSPSDVFTQGLNIAAALMDGASSSAFFTNPGTSIAVMISAAFVVLAFIAVTIQYIVAVVESYLVVSAGVIFLGFGGSRWTTPYVERYIGLGVSTGVKIMILYMLIGMGLNLSGGWLDEAVGIGTSPNPSMTGFDVMGAALIFMMLCWQVPKLFAAVLGGSPALSGGDLVSTGTAVVGGAATVASLGAGAIAAAAGGAAAASGGASAASGSAGGGASSTIASVGGVSGANGAAGGGTVPPPSSPPRGPSSNGRPSQPNPPGNGGGGAAAPVFSANGGSNGAGAPQSRGQEVVGRNGQGQSRFADAPATRSALSSMGGESLAGSGFEAEHPAAGFSSTSVPVAPSPRRGSGAPGQGSLFGANSDSVSPADVTPSDGLESSAASSPVAEVSSVGGPTAGKAQTQAPPSRGRLASGARRTQRVFSGAADRLRGTRRQFGGLPTDAAPHAQPPRMPIDHSE
ncbi:MAG: P-type conjugative transfer protein TrbL [Bryobacteraceae bacterium]